MKKDTVYVGYDHNGFVLKTDLIKFLKKLGYQVRDVGNKVLDPNDDFPEFAAAAATQVLLNPNAKAVLICGGGQGMCMAANRFRGIRASVLWDAHEARVTRNDNDANICCLPGKFLTGRPEIWQDIVQTFLETPFSGAVRYKRRNAQIDEFN
ncbi:MAG: RpiB/LacA/LacB family sugar-phosphate isomerase [Candidatus Nanosyncoccaceae bacterium]|jgi:ribose 5-phosphate isomerase B